MSKDKRANPTQYPTAAEALAAPGDRCIKAARNVVSRRIDGIPKRGYIDGSCDHAPVIRGVRDLTEAVYDLLDALDSGAVDLAVRESVRALLEDHKCA